MNKNTKNKLLHFYTTGSIYDDFAKSRAQKTAKLRRIIRICFYVHCTAAILCIALAAALHAGLGIIAIAFSEAVLAALAFLAVGDMTLMKTMLYCGDILFAASMFIAGALNETKAPFFVTGAVSVVTALVALGAFFAAMCKLFLDGFSPLAIRREHYTLLPNFSTDVPEVIPVSDVEQDAPDHAEEPESALPPPRSEFQLLADKVRVILHTENTEVPE